MFNKHKKRLHGTIGEDTAKIINDSTPLGIVEAFRTLYTNIQYLSIADKCKKIAVTSAVAGEGKSYICANLSITLAQSNTKNKILVIDADMRRPRLAALLKNYIKEGNTEVGLTEYLAGIVDTPNILRTTLDNLFVLSSGSNAPNPTSFIISEKFDQVIKLFESEYDYIIFDTPPVNIVSDALILSKKINGFVISTKADYSNIHDLNEVVSKISSVGGTVYGIVLSNVDLKNMQKRYSSYIY